MKKLVIILALISASQVEALTVKSDFLRAAQIVEQAKFPLNLSGYLHLSFRLDLDEADQKGVNATVDKLIAGEVVDTYKGYLVYGKRESVEFSDGFIGPKILLEQEEVSGAPVQEDVPEITMTELPDEEQEVV